MLETVTHPEANKTQDVGTTSISLLANDVDIRKAQDR